MNIREIAALAGVSRTTISRYLNGGYVGREARARIAQVLAETGYTPNIQAQAFRTRRSRLVGIVVPPYATEVVHSVTDEILSLLEDAGYHVLVMRYRESAESIADVVDQMRSRGVDGIIAFLIIVEPAVREALLRGASPAVTIGPAEVEGVAGVVHADAEAFAMLARAAIEAGYTDIGTAFPAPRATMTRLRLAGVCSVLERQGLPIRPEWHIACDGGPRISHHLYGEMLGEKFLKLPRKPRAILGGSDRIALGIMRRLRQAGCRVPQDIALAGSGNIEWDTFASPTLTSVGHSPEDMAATAVRLLLERMGTPESGVRQVRMTPELFRRESL